jgi:hypothetical protein
MTSSSIRRCTRTKTHQFGAICTTPGNLCLYRTAWWGWGDSNFQPNDYQSLALSSRHRWPAPAWYGRRSPQRLVGGMVPTGPDALPSCAVIAGILKQSLWVVASVRGNGIFATETKPPKSFHLKFNWPFAESSFGHFASHEIPTSGPLVNAQS